MFKVLFTGNIFSKETIAELKKQNVQIISERIDLSEGELTKAL